MTNQVSTIRRLAREVGWSESKLLQWVCEWDLHPWQSLDDALQDLDERDLTSELLSDLLDDVPFKVELHSSEDGMVTVYCNSQVLAEHDQTICGSRWECPSDMNVAYAGVADHPKLQDELRAEGYAVDDTNYYPEEESHGVS